VAGAGANLSDRRRRARAPGEDRACHRPSRRRTAYEEITVFIAIVDFRTTADDRPAALAQLDAEREEVRAMPGNLAFRVYAAREDAGLVTIVHEWDDEASFGGYQRSAAFARSGQVLRPMASQAPVSRRFRAELVETVA
jgi:quinol monooxygenase YgiN